jgi:hypothetical protein
MRKIALPPIGLVLIAGLADAAGAHSLAFYALVIAVPAAAVAALAALDAALDHADGARFIARAWLQGVVLALILTSAAVRAPAHGGGSVPRLAVTALVACLAVFACQGLFALLPRVQRRAHGRLFAGRI